VQKYSIIWKLQSPGVKVFLTAIFMAEPAKQSIKNLKEPQALDSTEYAFYKTQNPEIFHALFTNHLHTASI